jgi:hypothetical protein
MNFADGSYFGKQLSDLSITSTSPSTDLLYTTAAGASYNSFSAGQLRLTPGVGYLHEETRTNNLLNSTAPATQTTGSLATGTYVLWVNGTGSASVAAGSATITGGGSATNGSFVTFVVTVAGTVTVTKTGSLNAFQLENGAFPTSLIVTAGVKLTRNRDTVNFPQTFGAAYTGYARFTPYIPASVSAEYEILNFDDAGSNRATLARGTAGTLKGALAGGTGVSIFAADALTPNTSNRGIFSVAAGSQAISQNGETVVTGSAAVLPGTPTEVTIGSLVGATGAFNGYIERIAGWANVAVSSANIPSVGSRLISGMLEVPNGASVGPIDGVTYVAGNADDVTSTTVASWAMAHGVNPSTGGSLDRFEVRPGDYPPPGSALKERAEFSQSNLLANGTTVWVAYSVYLFQSAIDGNCTVGQYHPTQGVGDTVEGTNLYMAVFNGTLRFDKQTSTEVPLVDFPAPTQLFFNTPPAGQWIKFVHQINVDPNGVTSLWKVWENGTLIINSTAAMGFANSPGNHWKFGLYRNTIGGNSVAWYANMEFGTSDLSARIAAPLALPLDTPY